MKSLFLKNIIAFTIFIAAFTSCTTHLKFATDEKKISENEIRLIMAGDKETEMDIVKNDGKEGIYILRSKNKLVDPLDPMIQLLTERMLVTVEKAPGVGIAAPQVGINRSIIWVQRLDKPQKPFEVYYNVEITNYSEEKKIGWEGCLSIPAGFGKVLRSTSIEIEYDGRDGVHKIETIEGFTAVIFQHEIDHLKGELFTDKKVSGDLLSKEAYYEMRKKEKEAAAKEKVESPK